MKLQLLDQEIIKCHEAETPQHGDIVTNKENDLRTVFVETNENNLKFVCNLSALI